MITTDAWVLHRRPDDPAVPKRGELSRETFSFADVADHEALVEPLVGSWEANLDHALSRDPIDICRQRGESSVVLGNLAVVRVLRTGADVTSVSEGDTCLVLPFGECDRYGYVERVYAYDMPHTVGLLAKRTKLHAGILLPLPEDTPFSLAQWATYGRYFTAWDNWNVAHACWSAQMRDEDPAKHLVFGWGGGVAMAELELARRAGFRVAMTASTDARLSFLAEHGITGVDRRLFPDLSYSAEVADDPEALARYRASEKEFLRIIGELSDGAGAAIFLDNIGSPLYKATLKAMARQGVLATVGWKHGMTTSTLRASECIKRHLHVNTHVWRIHDSARIRDFQNATAWMPPRETVTTYAFDDVPQLAADYAAGRITTYFPTYQVNLL
ncbi:zinc-binding dehydrogenase [Salinactinospora qingdaonensis]|uniref:Zinc-binding dehydrogenase n=1 Tax=Salinactinospora qingdaonensis TaxID=702744 RepID=A0ABP7FVF1_9ACTN